MAVETSQPEPNEPAGSAAVAAFNKALEATPMEEEQPVAAPAEAKPPEEPKGAEPSPATIIIPLNRIPEKFRSKPEAIVEAYENAEKWGTQSAQETARLRKEADELRAKVAAYEVQRQPQQPALNHWQTANINPGEDIIVAPEKVANHVWSEAERRAMEVGRQAAREEVNQLRSENLQKEQMGILVNALEGAKNLARTSGYEVTDEEWRQTVRYIAPLVVEENKDNPGAAFDPNRYFEHYKILKGAPAKATLPTEGAPPVAAKSATVNTGTNVPTLNREEQQIKKQIDGALAHLMRNA